MIELHTTNDIDKRSIEILKGSKSFDVFPTPVDKIIAYSELVVNRKIDIAVIEPSYLAKASGALNHTLHKALSKVRGLFDRKEKVIYLDLSQKTPRKNFVKLHEVGHGVLEWQQNTYDYLEDDDNSLSDHTTEDFEAEANYFASVTLFQHDRFITELNKLGLGLDSVMQLSKHFGASIHATLRRYVECSSKRCALLVLENMNEKGTPRCSKRDFFISKKFDESFGKVMLPDEFGFKWDFVKPYYFKRKGIQTGTISLETQNGTADFNFHFFYNYYNGLVFLFPTGEKKATRTKIIVTESL
jgi:Zn-dependent peptidase ImmA (M78 family)